MPRRDEAPPLVRCGDLSCPWEACIRLCPHRIQGQKGDVFPHTICGFYSQPGPHAVSKIARVTGMAPKEVHRAEDEATRKLREKIQESLELSYDEDLAKMVMIFEERCA